MRRPFKCHTPFSHLPIDNALQQASYASSLSNNGSSFPALYYAVVRNSAEAVATLLEYDADPNAKQPQFAKTHNITGVLKLPYHIIGQDPAAKHIKEEVLAHTIMDVDEPEPLMMVFAGPPGHGKTETAKQMGDLLPSTGGALIEPK
ncbi:hypothetical protein K469DRAFT_772645 [Zopfia rhizophila CBS 207.26]|uniref:Uncharacterized protein n=1 Tax=Zopfia rhizophila CBS 207.26 TaxID=1314779 RepID=A0A6A6E8M5_9PEZI|nr:hypothetical protein K469DRAFT_772645 [Zopfia rhizophila CBS 207.26]